MIKGNRVNLHRIREEDWEMRYRWVSDPEVNRTLSAGLGIPLSASQVKDETALLAAESAKWAYFTVVTEEGLPINRLLMSILRTEYEPA